MSEKFRVVPGKGIVRATERVFNAGRPRRTDASWVSPQLSANQHIKFSLYQLQTRARDLAMNNSTVAGFVNILVRNIVGKNGITVKPVNKSISGKIDDALNARIAGAWKSWCENRSFCDTRRKTNFVGLQRLVTRSWGTVGEAFALIVQDKEANKGNPYNFSIQLIDAERIDSFYTGTTPEGNIVTMGVELNQWQQVEAYWFKDWKDPENLNGSRVRVPAGDVIHFFNPITAEAVRGVPIFSAAMLDLHHLDEYRSNELIAAEMSAKQPYFIQKESVEDGEFREVYDEETGEVTELEQSIEPGQINILRPGESIVSPQLNHPGTTFSEFTKQILKSIASSLPTSYGTLTGDYSELNFSGSRVGLQEERDEYDILQDSFTKQFVLAVYRRFVVNLVRIGMLQAENGFDALLQCKTVGRRWNYVDPARDAKGVTERLANGTASIIQVCEENGDDAFSIAEDNAAVVAFYKSKGIEMTWQPSMDNAPVDETSVPSDPSAGGVKPKPKGKKNAS